MNQYKKTALLWVLLLAICTALLSGCINADMGDFYPHATITTTATQDVTVSTTPEETTAEETTPEESTTTPEPVKKIKIYIDQGHNPFLPKQDPNEENKGWNTGAFNAALGLHEPDLTYDFGIRLAEMLEQDDRFEVRLSRSTPETILGTDQNSALDFRVNDATEWGADYFISLHINSFTDSSVRGLEVYTANGDEVGYAIGYEILNALAKSTGLRNRGMRDGSDLRVLKNAQMPAALIEMGYLSNEDDAILLRDSSELFVQGLYNGIQSYFNNLEMTTDVIAEEA